MPDGYPTLAGERAQDGDEKWPEEQAGDDSNDRVRISFDTVPIARFRTTGAPRHSLPFNLRVASPLH